MTWPPGAPRWTTRTRSWSTSTTGAGASFSAGLPSVHLGIACHRRERGLHCREAVLHVGDPSAGHPRSLVPCRAARRLAACMHGGSMSQCRCSAGLQRTFGSQATQPGAAAAIRAPRLAGAHPPPGAHAQGVRILLHKLACVWIMRYQKCACAHAAAGGVLRTGDCAISSIRPYMALALHGSTNRGFSSCGVCSNIKVGTL